MIQLLTPKRILAILLLGVFILLAADLVCIYRRHILNIKYSFCWNLLFDMRFNFPWLYAYGLLFISIALIFVLVSANSLPRATRHFFNTAGILLVIIAINRSFHFHNRMRMASVKLFSGSGGVVEYLKYIWVLPYALVFGVGTLYLIRNYFQLPSLLKKQLLISASLYLFGAVVLELIGNVYGDRNPVDFLYMLIKTAEDLCQMLGLVYLIYTVSNYQKELRSSNVT